MRGATRGDREPAMREGAKQKGRKKHKVKLQHVATTPAYGIRLFPDNALSAKAKHCLSSHRLMNALCSRTKRDMLCANINYHTNTFIHIMIPSDYANAPN
jgi:hypothetical protein